MSRSRSSLASVTALCLALVLMGGVALAAPPEVDSEVPDLSLPDLGGETRTLSERIAEGPVVLVFFRGAW